MDLEAPAAVELEWEYVRFQLDAMVELGLSRLGPAETKAAPPREMHLELTHRCDLKCVMCEHWQVQHLDPSSVSRELDFAAVRRMVESSPLLADLETIVITGGEPWLRHDLVDVLEWLSGRLPQARVIVLTNLWNTGHLRRRLSELRARGLKNVHLGSSMDGLGATHDRIRGQEGAFSGLMRTVRALRAEFPEVPFGLTFTILPQNAAELFDAYLYATLKLGVGFGAQWAIQTDGIAPILWTEQTRRAALEGIRKVLLDLCRRTGAAEKMRGQDRAAHRGLWTELAYWRWLEEYGREPRRFPFFRRCTAGERHAMIGAEGELYFCPVNRAKAVGSVKEAPLDALWNSKKADEVRAFVDSGECHCWLRCVSAPAIERLIGLAT